MKKTSLQIDILREPKANGNAKIYLFDYVFTVHINDYHLERLVCEGILKKIDAEHESHTTSVYRCEEVV